MLMRTETCQNGRLRRTAGCVAVGVLVAVLLAGPAAARERTYRFIVLGDNRPGRESPIAQPPIYLETVDEVNRLAPDFVVNVGDLILGYVEDEAVIRQMWAEFERVSAAYAMPHYRTFGNHDVWDQRSQRIAEDLYPDLYYSFTHKGDYFVVLCSDLADTTDHIAGQQFAWLEKGLRRHRRSPRKFVFVHKPLWKNPESNWLDEVHPLLARHGVTMVFAGHAHKYEKSRTRDGVQYFITGGAGAPLREDRSPAQGWFHHYLHVSVNGDDVTLAVIKTGSVKDQSIITYQTPETETP